MEGGPRVWEGLVSAEGRGSESRALPARPLAPRPLIMVVAESSAGFPAFSSPSKLTGTQGGALEAPGETQWPVEVGDPHMLTELGPHGVSGCCQGPMVRKEASGRVGLWSRETGCVGEH